MLTPNVPLDLELDVCDQSQRWASDITVISQLELHFAQQDSSDIHVWLSEIAGLNVSKLNHHPSSAWSSLFLASTLQSRSVQKPHNGDSLHHTRSRVAQELASWFQCSVDSDSLLWCHVKVRTLGWVMRSLLRNVVGFRAIVKVPVAGEMLTEDWVEGLLDSRWFDVPS